MAARRSLNTDASSAALSAEEVSLKSLENLRARSQKSLFGSPLATASVVLDLPLSLPPLSEDLLSPSSPPLHAADTKAREATRSTRTFFIRSTLPGSYRRHAMSSRAQAGAAIV